MSHRQRTVLPATLWFLLIMVLLSLPGSSFPEVNFWKPDKIAHFGLFGMQTVLLWIAFAYRRAAGSSSESGGQHNAGSKTENGVQPNPGWGLLLRAAIITLIFGALSEYYQDVFTSRLADTYDILANAIGIALACLFIAITGRMRILHLSARLLRLPLPSEKS
ncbi:hypothetical protein KQI65_03980 [bacterium]|nr:hypothetical protein [bacterium]